MIIIIAFSNQISIAILVSVDDFTHVLHTYNNQISLNVLIDLEHVLGQWKLLEELMYSFLLSNQCLISVNQGKYKFVSNNNLVLP